MSGQQLIHLRTKPLLQLASAASLPLDPKPVLPNGRTAGLVG
jgi:hypothetical protein